MNKQTSIKITNLPLSISQKTLFDMFKKIRKEVGDLPIEIQDESSESKQAIVSFLTHEEGSVSAQRSIHNYIAKAALEEFNGTKIEGREIKIYFTSQNIVYTQEHEEEEDYEEYDDYEDYEDDAEEYPEGYEEHLKEFLEQNNEDYDEYDDYDADYDDDYYRKKKKGKVKYIPVDPEPPTTKKDETKQETKEEPKEKPKEEVKKEEVKEESKEKQKEQPKAEQKEESKKESKSEKVKSKENKPEQTTDTKKEKQSKGVETKKESKEPIARIAYVSVKDLPKTNIPTIKNALKATFGNDIGIGLIDYDAEKGTATIDLVVPVSPFGKKIKIGDAEIMLRKRNIMKPKSPQPMQQVEQKEEQKEVPKKAPEEKRTTKPVKEDTPKESPNKEEQKKHYPKKDKYQHHDKRQYRRGGDYKGDKRGNRDGKKEYDYTATVDLFSDLKDLDEKQLGIVFGRIIGKDGENIRRIGKETNAFLDLNKDSKILKINSNDRRFKAQAAAEKVRKIIEECKKGFSEKK